MLKQTWYIQKPQLDRSRFTADKGCCLSLGQLQVVLVLMRGES